MITTQIKERIIRGYVHIVENAQGTVYEATENPLRIKVNIQQIELHPGNKRVVKIASIDGDIDYMFNCGFSKGAILEGNILHIQTLEPLDPGDPEWGLLWDNNKVVRVYNQPVYQYSCYRYDIPYQQYGDIDELCI